MSVHVQLQISGTRKRGVADEAYVRFRTGMGAHVLYQLPASSESLAAMFAFVRSISGMGAQVQLQSVFDGKRFFAVMTYEYGLALQSRRVFTSDVVF